MSPRVSDLFLRSQSDERLVNLARTGHARAFAAIVERYGPELAALARRLRPDGKDEDVVQQAFLSAFAALRAGADVKHLRGWLYQIVRNASSRERVVRSVPLDGGLAAPDTLEDVVAQRALAMDALSELSRLPERQRQAMIGSALDGMGRADLASSMGLSEGAVRQLIHRARTTLRSAVTALTPWPIASWLAARSAGGAAAVSAGAGGAISSGGMAMKFGAVLASGALATGVATVALHPARPHRRDHRAAVSLTSRNRSGAHGASTASLAGGSPSTTGVLARIGSTRRTSAVEVSFVPGRTPAGSARSRGRARADGGRSPHSGGGGGGADGQAESSSQHGQPQRGGDGRGDASGQGDGRSAGPQRGDGSGQGGEGTGQPGGDGGQRQSGADQRHGGGTDRPAGGGNSSQDGAGATAFASTATSDGQGSDHGLGHGVGSSPGRGSGDGTGSGGLQPGGVQSGGSQSAGAQPERSQSDG